MGQREGNKGMKEHIEVIQAALKRERLNIEMSDLSKGHEAREFAKIDSALAWLDTLQLVPAAGDSAQPSAIIDALDELRTKILKANLQEDAEFALIQNTDKIETMLMSTQPQKEANNVE